MNNNTIVINGVNGYLGKEILERVIKDFKVIGLSRNAGNLINEISEKYRFNYFPLNIDYKYNDVDEVCEKIKKKSQENNLLIKGLVNNGFTGYPEYSYSIDKNSVHNAAEGLFGYHIRLATKLSDQMKTSGSIVNISSMYGKVAPKPDNYTETNNLNPILYGTMKAALIQASKYLSSQLGIKGIRVNSVSYGPFPSKENQKKDPQFIEKLSTNTHLRRVGKSEEAGGIVNFLLSNEASFITGADISVDGGWTAW